MKTLPDREEVRTTPLVVSVAFEAMRASRARVQSGGCEHPQHRLVARADALPRTRDELRLGTEAATWEQQEAFRPSGR
jgi:hypothetical protein